MKPTGCQVFDNRKSQFNLFLKIQYLMRGVLTDREISDKGSVHR